MSRPRSIILPLESDEEVCVQAYPDDGDVRIRLSKGGFVRAGLFRFALDKGEPGVKIVRGPVIITVSIGREPVVDVEITLAQGEKLNHRFESDVCDEVLERIDQVKALLHSYAADAEAMQAAEKKRRESRRPQAAA